MPRRPHKNDISIGKDLWIEFGDLAGGQASAVQIDPHLAPIMAFIESLETECEAGCCGIDAFRLWPDVIRKAIAKLGLQEIEELPSKLASVSSAICQLPSDTVVSTRINQYFRKVVFLELLEHIRNVVVSVQSSLSESVAPGQTVPD